ncbi:MAG: hypothetical protein JRJ49_01880 [Deltaproteobacteria bacterium]|jgi:hypothetical protein|nr:hypothetical protein [Deltaproteobacteria bacterium]
MNKYKFNLITIIISLFFLGASILNVVGCGKKGDPVPKSTVTEKEKCSE